MRNTPSVILSLLLALLLSPAGLRAQLEAVPQSGITTKAVASSAPTSEPVETALSLATAARKEAAAQRAHIATLAANVRPATAANAEAHAQAAALLQARRDFAEERETTTQDLLELMGRLPDPEQNLDFLQSQNQVAELANRRNREAELARGQANLLAKQGGQTGKVGLAEERATFLQKQAHILSQLKEELARKWQQAFPDASTRKAAEAAAFKALSEARKKEQEEAERKAQEQVAAREKKKKEAAELAEKARQELEQAANVEEQQLAELRLRYATLKSSSEDFKVKALQSQAETKRAEEEEGRQRAEMVERVPVLLTKGSDPSKVAEYRNALLSKASELRQQVVLLQKEIELAREKVPAFRTQYRKLVELYDDLEEGMARNRSNTLYRRRTYFARLAQRKASERLDQYRTFVEWKDRLLISWLRLAEAMERAAEELKPHSEIRYQGQTRKQLEQFALFLFLTLLASLVVDFLARTLFKSFSDRTSWTWDDIALEELSAPIRILVFLAGLQLSLNILTLTQANKLVLSQWGGAFRAAWLGFLAWRMLNIVTRVLEPSIAKSEAKLDDQLAHFLKRGLRSVIVGTSLVFLLEAFGWKVTSLLAGLGIGGLAFALAAKDTLANLFGSIVLFMDRPFRVGNWVKISGVEGVVEDIGIRSTRIRTFKDTVVTIPNANVANSPAENVHSFRKRRLYFTLELRFDTDVDTIEKTVDKIRDLLTEHPMILDGFYVFVTGIKASGVEIMVYCFVATRDWGEWLVHGQDVYLSVLRLLEELGAGLAFPTQTIELEHPKGMPRGLSPFTDQAPTPGPGEGPKES
jgi:MscS family membrane protein